MRFLSVFVAAATAGCLALPAAAETRARTPQGLTYEQALSQYLLAEIAQQRGQADFAVQDLIDLARRGRDPRIARRATEVAFQSRQMDLAVEACLLWAELEPGSPVVRQALSALAANNGNLAAAKANIAKWLSDERAPVLFLQMSGILARFPEKVEAAAAVRELARSYPKLPEAHWAMAESALLAGDAPMALTEVDVALRLRKGWPQAAILKAQALRESSPDNAEKYLQTFLVENPKATDARVAYARSLVAAKGYLSAREQFRLAVKDRPDDPELPYAIALLSQQIGDFADADLQFQRVLELKPRDPNPVYFNLGVVAELRKDAEGAMGWFRRVNESDYFVPAQLKIATVLAGRDGLGVARKFLSEARQVERESSDTRIQLVLAEVQLLREAKAFRDALSFLTESLKLDPDAADLLYDRAMIAEKLDKIALMEADLRRVIELQPERSHAYNALGYTLAERNIRLDEARELIEKALAISPDDMFIQDSLGWLQYRQGKVADALATLGKAYRARRDAEIAAHLGEVLWVAGRRDEARKLLEGALLEHPGSEVLGAALEKCKP
ncbi:MAG: tetratricopeptide repeat protein [Betaproteobacteria bacterium]|nr:tetratricopeptide repeat protein [Betaproteobacteria bacterium]